jgi:outer membrane protein assembly factor BamB
MNRLAIRAIPAYTSSRIVNLDPEGKFIDRVNIPGWTSTHISLRDGTIKCTDCKTNSIYCYTLTGEEIWTFNNQHVLQQPVGIALDKNKNAYVAGKGTNNVVILSPDGMNRIHYVSTLTVASSWYAMRLVQHFFSLYIKYKL